MGYEVCDRRVGGLNAQGCNGKNMWSKQQHCCADNSHPARAVPCCDAAFRTFDVVDAEAPTIEVMGDKNLIIDASTKVYRRVFVKDTLPPVITLHLRNKLIAAGNGKQKGVNGVMNPAGTAAGNPNIKYMAEETTSSVNGWIVGALASAVTGLALLGYSLRKS